MQITLAFLQDELKSIQAQKQQALNVAFAADGASQLINSLIERLNAPEPTESE